MDPFAASDAGDDLNPDRAPRPSTPHLRCRPPEVLAGDSVEETLERYQQALVELAQCFDDELTIRPESSLLSRIVIKILLPFAAVSAALSAFFAGSVAWAKERFVYTEYALGIGHLLLALALLGLWLTFRKTERFPRVRRLRDQIRTYLESRTPRRNETLTRNHIVNDWIYFWFVFGVVFFVPFVFFLFRANAFDRIGMNLIIDTAGICKSGSDGISLYRGSDTCASIAGTATGSSPTQAEATEIRLDATTTLTLYAVVLAAGIVVSMLIWWF